MTTELVEDQDGAPYAEGVQQALRDARREGAQFIAHAVEEFATDQPDATALSCATVAGTLAASMRPLTDSQIARGQEIERALLPEATPGRLLTEAERAERARPPWACGREGCGHSRASHLHDPLCEHENAHPFDGPDVALPKGSELLRDLEAARREAPHPHIPDPEEGAVQELRAEFAALADTPKAPLRGV